MPLQCPAMLIVMPRTSLSWEVDGQVWPAHASDVKWGIMPCMAMSGACICRGNSVKHFKVPTAGGHQAWGLSPECGSLAGFGATKHLAEQGYNVTLLDASPHPGGLSAGWRTPQGRAVEAGTKGFWYQVGTLTCTGESILPCQGRYMPVLAHVGVSGAASSPHACRLACQGG